MNYMFVESDKEEKRKLEVKKKKNFFILEKNGCLLYWQPLDELN